MVNLLREAVWDLRVLENNLCSLRLGQREREREREFSVFNFSFKSTLYYFTVVFSILF